MRLAQVDTVGPSTATTPRFALRAVAIRSHLRPVGVLLGARLVAHLEPDPRVTCTPVALGQDELDGLRVLDPVVGHRVLQRSDEDNEMPRFTLAARRRRRADA